ncbi:MAG: hypothetical protein V7L02_11605 [Nostoc sp.]|uniref:hypothetical protein n=1 Tax=Nostoc sp. TaxID=1180 RepID=UPI002FF5FEDA
MSNLIFSQTLAFALYQSSEQFPVDLDDAWLWLGHAKKNDVLEKLKDNFEEGLDFSEKSAKASTGGRPRRYIVLSIDCFKHLAMMAGTPQGKIIRKYFLECERIAKTAIANSQPQLPSITNAKLAQLTTEKEAIRTRIKELRQLLSKEESKLQAVSEALIEEAKAFSSTNRELMQQSALCQQILDEAKDNNPFLSVGSTKR